MKKILLLCTGLAALLFVACKQENEKPAIENEKTIIGTIESPVRHEPTEKVTYQMVNTKEWLAKNKTDEAYLKLVYAANRTDAANLKKMDSVIVPKDKSGDIEFYLPFPLEVKALQDIHKIILFSYPTQTFVAYDKGRLVYTGPTNMGREKDPTPTGLFFTNWKAEETTSTFNDEWILKWNFNIENKLGVGFHQYTLPGYPASHSCLRLQEKDARYLYDWADEWVLEDNETVKVKGTPVIVFGSYDFKAPKPWLKLLDDPKALNISEEEIARVVKPFKDSIMIEQKKRADL
ncbi:L,D-transpeptidase [Flavobacterium sp. ST-87]|uniref:L,D-transpeptidase n=1 Tax=Flavobacterium plantiphilum TaxID=3163297 RepID=A0ABW8XT93_9FLAO